MKVIEEKLRDNITYAKKWLNANGDTKLLFTQKVGIRFLYVIILKKNIEILNKERMKKYLVDSINDGKIKDEDGDVISFENVENLFEGGKVDEVVNSIFIEKFNGISLKKVLMEHWTFYKPSSFIKNKKISDLNDYINSIASFIEEFDVIPKKIFDLLSALFEDIEKHIPTMTFDEEVVKLFNEEKTLLIRIYDASNTDFSAANKLGLLVVNKEYKENWELFLWWVISRNNSCRCILSEIPNSVIIIGKEKNVNDTVTLYEMQCGEIMKNSDDCASKKVESDLKRSIPPKKNYVKIELLTDTQYGKKGEILEKSDAWFSHFLRKVGIEFLILKPSKTKGNVILNKNKSDYLKGCIKTEVFNFLEQEMNQNNNNEADVFIEKEIKHLGNKYIDIALLDRVA